MPKIFSWFIPTWLIVCMEALVKSTDTGSLRSMKLYPNPASDRFYIYPDVPRGSQLLLSVFTSNGLKLMEQSLVYHGQGIEILSSDWEKGLYLISCSWDHEIFTGKIIIQ